MCEKTLARRFVQGMDDFKRQKLWTQVHNNSEKHQLQMDVIDFHQNAGAKIDRETNRKEGISAANPFFMDMPSFTLYMPKNPMQLASMLFQSQGGDSKKPLRVENVTLEVLVRFKTNLKLSVAGLDQKTEQTVYMGYLREDEYHFVRFEGLLPPIEMSMDSIKNLI